MLAMDETRKRLNIWRFPYKFTPGRILGIHPSYLPRVDAYTSKVFLSGGPGSNSRREVCFKQEVILSVCDCVVGALWPPATASDVAEVLKCFTSRGECSSALCRAAAEDERQVPDAEYLADWANGRNTVAVHRGSANVTLLLTADACWPVSQPVCQRITTDSPTDSHTTPVTGKWYFF